MHRYGGTWTEIKLDVVEGYLDYYTKVLANKPTPANPFKLWYIDAFAGSGSRTVDVSGGSIFDDEESSKELELEGSARRALRIPRPFDRYVFIEGHGGRFSELEKLKAEFPQRSIVCLPGDANLELSKVFGSPPWSGQVKGRGDQRAVVFLDPYGMSVKWSTLELLARSGSADVWYLFPVEGVNRQLSGELQRVDEYKRIKLEEIFGTPNWESELYEPVEQGGLFGTVTRSHKKTGSKLEIEAYALRRFSTIFNYVSEPIQLTGKRRGLIFSLICLSNSESPQAINLIKKGVKWLHQHYAFASASRRRSDR